jgi:NAD(P)H dehydrogenase (quinone)
MKVQIVFYSMYGHIWRMAEAVAEGARSVPGAEVSLRQVPELVQAEALEKSGAAAARKAFAHIPTATVDGLAEADAVIFGAPTRYGCAASQMRNFLDQTGSLWMKGSLIGKVGSVFTSSGTQHGGQETTIVGLHVTLLHHGMIIVGVPYSEKGLFAAGEMSGGSPYGASTIAGPDGSRLPSENELGLARAQGKRVAEIAGRLVG